MDQNKDDQKNGVLYKFLFLFVLCCNFVTVNLFAQFYMEESFPKYSYYLSEAMDMTWKQPEGFIWEKMGTTWWSQGEWGRKGLGSIYSGSMRSADKDCLILYPECSNVMFGSLRDSLNPNFIRRQMIYDMRDAFGKEFPLDSISPDLGQYVVTLVGKKAPFNADTVYIAQIPLKNPYQEKYTYCTGIYACKQGRPSITFKCFFTEEGKRKEERYLTKFYKAIRYRRNKKWSYDDEKALYILYKLYPKSR